MKKLLPAAALGLSALTLRPAQHLHSHLFIRPSKQFIPSGNQLSGFQVAGQKVDAIAVDVSERPRHGAQAMRGQLAPGQRTVLRFAEGSAAIICNANGRQAVLNLNITKYAQGLTMTYEPAVTNK